MAAADFSDVPLALVDTSVLSCWEEKVKQGVDCSLVLKHRQGKVITILKCSAVVVKNPEARNSSPLSSSPTSPHAERKKKKRNTRGEKKLESMLSYHQRLVVEKGLPPSRLMLEHAALAESLPPVNGTELQKPEVLRQLEHDQSLDISCASSKREETSFFNAEEEEPDVEEIERIRSILETTNQCYFCDYQAPVPWVHPSKGDNLSGRDIWDHVWAKHPRETDWFA